MVCFIVNGMWVVILGMNLTCVCVCVCMYCVHMHGYVAILLDVLLAFVF